METRQRTQVRNEAEIGNGKEDGNGNGNGNGKEDGIADGVRKGGGERNKRK